MAGEPVEPRAPRGLYGVSSELPRTWWLKTRLYSLTVMKAKCLKTRIVASKARCPQGHVPSEWKKKESEASPRAPEGLRAAVERKREAQIPKALPDLPPPGSVAPQCNKTLILLGPIFSSVEGGQEHLPERIRWRINNAKELG